MRTPKRQFFRWLAVAVAAAAVAAPAGHAGGPDDRALYRGIDPGLAPRTAGPDDRAFYRGTSSDALAPASVSPDDRAFARTTLVTDPAPVTVEVQSTGFDWGDAMIGAAFGLALALLGLGAMLITQRRRNALRPA